MDLSKFTPSQSHAITSPARNQLLVAGAGSGKTRTLTTKIGFLIEHDVSPTEILCLTFTRKAANEMRERISAIIGEAKTRKIRIGTFHSVCYSILCQWGSKIGYKTDSGEKISIITQEESDFVLGHVVTEYGFKGRKKDLEKSIAELSHKNKAPENEDHKRIIQEYKNRLKECNALDFNMLLLETQRLFQESQEEALEYYQTRWKYIFVDEYQDTDSLQYNLHELISPEYLFCVGDPDQAIYGWRGAELEIILRFDQDHGDAETIKLEECFRCAKNIVDAANSLIKQNVNRIDKTLIPVNPPGTITLKTFSEAWDLGPAIGQLISESLTFENPGEIAVLARTHRTLEAIEVACKALCVPVFRVGAASSTIEKTPEWRQFIGVLRGILNPCDNLAFHAYVMPWEGIDEDFLSQIISNAGKQGIYYSQAFYAIFPDSKTLMASQVGFSGYKSPIPSMSAFLAWFYNSYPKPELDPEIFHKHLEMLGVSDMTPKDFYSWLVTKDIQAEIEKKKEGVVTLITCHAAKGLEWDNVILADFSAGAFPSKFGEIEEERRLAYVAFTRARKNLFLFYKKPSQFLSEAGLGR